jgi:hypothetical protein
MGSGQRHAILQPSQRFNPNQRNLASASGL